MSTAAQIIANQANAQHSTGPKTVAGKATVALNHLSHGLSIRRHVVLPGEDQAAYEALLARYQEEMPIGAIQRALITQIAQAEWRIERCERILHHLVAESGLTIEAYYLQNEANLHRFERYAGQHRRDYARILKDFLAARRQLQNEANPPTGQPHTITEQPHPGMPAPDDSKPISSRIPFSFSSELVGLKRLHPDFDPARSKQRMSPSLRDYLKHPGNLYAAQQLMQFA